jgi:uncharacterized protein YkwD
VPLASPNREDRSPLSLAARVGIYALLATLVVASFVVTPPQRGGSAAQAPLGADRVVPAARAMARALRAVSDLDDAPASTPSPAPSEEPAAVPANAPEADASPEPPPDPTPEPPAPTPRPAPGPLAPLADATTAAAETHMLGLINASRVAGGLVPLAMDGGVASVARQHSVAESEVRYVYHDGPDGTARSRDVPACATGWFGENTGKIWNDNVDALHIEFMNEPWEPINHRTNIMDPNFRRVGIGAVLGPDAMYMTMVFCR